MPRVSNIDKALKAWKPNPVEPPIPVKAENLHRAARRYLLKEATM